LLAGFLRGSGPLVPLDLARAIDDAGAPVGYKLVRGAELLNSEDRALYEGLPARFRFKDVQGRMGGRSASNVTRFLKKSESLEIIKPDGMTYIKTVPSVESVERVECSDRVAPDTPSTPVA